MGTKIRDLTATTSVGANDFLVVAKSDNTTKKISGANLTSSLGGGGAGQLYIYTAGVGNASFKSYQTYIDTASAPKQAISAGVNYYILPHLFDTGAVASQTTMLQVITPSNLQAIVTPNFSWSSANAKNFGAFIHQGHIYCYHTSQYGSIAVSPLALLQV